MVKIIKYLDKFLIIGFLIGIGIGIGIGIDILRFTITGDGSNLMSQLSQPSLLSDVFLGFFLAMGIYFFLFYLLPHTLKRLIGREANENHPPFDDSYRDNYEGGYQDGYFLGYDKGYAQAKKDGLKGDEDAQATQN